MKCRPPYFDKLPNGLHVVRIDSAEYTGVQVVAFLPIGMTVDDEIATMQLENAKFIVDALKNK